MYVLHTMLFRAITILPRKTQLLVLFTNDFHQCSDRHIIVLSDHDNLLGAHLAHEIACMALHQSSFIAREMVEAP